MNHRSKFRAVTLLVLLWVVGVFLGVPSVVAVEQPATSLLPSVRISETDQSAEVADGSVVIESSPNEVLVSMLDVGLVAFKKTGRQMIVEGAPNGIYTVILSAPGWHDMIVVVTIEPGRRNLIQTKLVPIDEKQAEEVSTGSGGSDAPSLYANFNLVNPNIRMIWISPGQFDIGSNVGPSHETPVTNVRLTDGFWLGETEVTQEQYQTVMGSNPSRFRGPDRPVENVSRNDVQRFLIELNRIEREAGRLPLGYAYALPSESQWEYAARAGSAEEAPAEVEAVGWFAGNSGGETRSVRRKAANKWGLYDMLGNVWEWCLDTKEPYPGGSVSNYAFRGLNPSARYVYRGGSWWDPASTLRPAYRNDGYSTLSWQTVGFRLALSKRFRANLTPSSYPIVPPSLLPTGPDR